MSLKKGNRVRSIKYNAEGTVDKIVEEFAYVTLDSHIKIEKNGKTKITNKVWSTMDQFELLDAGDWESLWDRASDET